MWKRYHLSYKHLFDLKNIVETFSNKLRSKLLNLNKKTKRIKKKRKNFEQLELWGINESKMIFFWIVA